jgi:hypothetical protein
MADALTEAGAGVIGDYTHCTFRASGTGTFFGGEGTDPYAGEKGRLERVPELRLETVVPAHAASWAAAAVRAAHPYEEPAFDLYPVDGYPEGCGYGRVGTLPEPLAPEELREHVSDSLGFPARLVADPEPGRRIDRVAVSGLGQLFSRGSRGLGRWRLRHRRSRLPRRAAGRVLGLVAIDAGHAATELPSLEPLAQRLAELVDIPISVSRVQR